MLSRQGLLELYADTRLEFARFTGNRFVKLPAQRVRARLVTNRFRREAFFVNGHHDTLFRAAFPGIWSQLERRQPLSETMVATLDRDCPRTLFALQATGALSD